MIPTPNGIMHLTLNGFSLGDKVVVKKEFQKSAKDVGEFELLAMLETQPGKISCKISKQGSFEFPEFLLEQLEKV